MAESHPLPPRLAAILEDLPLDELAFAPVPARPQRRLGAGLPAGLHPSPRARGLRRLGGAAVGKTKASAYRLRERPGAESFAAAWDRALGWGRERSVDLGFERALCGEEVPVMYRGRRVGARQKFDNRLLIAVLNATCRAEPEAPPEEDVTLAYQRALAALDRDWGFTENKGFSRPI